jgi:hypothetical protein
VRTKDFAEYMDLPATEREEAFCRRCLHGRMRERVDVEHAADPTARPLSQRVYRDGARLVSEMVMGYGGPEGAG